MGSSIDWNSVFVPAIGLAEVIVRGSLMYLGLFIILRVMARRQAGHFGPADLLVIVLIADVAQNGLGKDYASIKASRWFSQLLPGNMCWTGFPGDFPGRGHTLFRRALLLFVTGTLFPKICARK
jgi:hypothetical protein